MSRRIAAVFIMVPFVFATLSVKAQTAQGGLWLDKQQPQNWNKAGAVLPRVPKGSGANLRAEPRCKELTRRPETGQDKWATSFGWSLFGPVQSYSGTTIIEAMSDVDGMCRPNGYQAFVFVNGRYAGSLAPALMDARTDGSLSEIKLYSASMIVAEFARYADADPLCCPTRTSTVNYRVDITPKGPVVVPTGIETTKNQVASDSPVEKTSVVGTVSYRERMALPNNALINVMIADVSRGDAASSVIAETTIETKGSQVPIPFEISYDPARIQQNASYAISAKVTVDGQLWFTTTTNVGVITKGNPTRADLLVARARH